MSKQKQIVWIDHYSYGKGVIRFWLSEDNSEELTRMSYFEDLLPYILRYIKPCRNKREGGYYVDLTALGKEI